MAVPRSPGICRKHLAMDVACCGYASQFSSRRVNPDPRKISRQVTPRLYTSAALRYEMSSILKLLWERLSANNSGAAYQGVKPSSCLTPAAADKPKSAKYAAVPARFGAGAISIFAGLISPCATGNLCR